MGVYLVRLKNKPKEFVGIYSCDPQDLSAIVDECTEPGACEYTEIGDGGVYVSDKAPAVPFTGEPEDCPAFLNGATITSSWEHYFYDEVADWLPLSPDTIRPVANVN